MVSSQSEGMALKHFLLSVKTVSLQMLVWFSLGKTTNDLL